MEKTSTSIEETREVANELVENLPVSAGNATVLALQGDLGSGKTTLVQMIARGLGVEGEITSPTFVIMKRYETKNDRFKELVHIDAYRIEESKELLTLGWNEVAARPHTLVCIEWPERVADLMPDDAATVSCKFVDEKTRAFSITYAS